jgi:hypothetical protein
MAHGPYARDGAKRLIVTYSVFGPHFWEAGTRQYAAKNVRIYAWASNVYRSIHLAELVWC